MYGNRKISDKPNGDVNDRLAYDGCTGAAAPKRLLLEEKLAPPKAVTDVVCGRIRHSSQRFGEIVLR
jgi:hypothetical protein